MQRTRLMAAVAASTALIGTLANAQPAEIKPGDNLVVQVDLVQVGGGTLVLTLRLERFGS